MLEQQHSTNRGQSRSQTTSDDGLLLSKPVMDDSMWDIFPQDDPAFATAPEDLATSLGHQSADALQGSSVPFPAQSPSWELSAVGLQEPLPTQQTIDQLYVLS
jgi:hypothetical protein